MRTSAKLSEHHLPRKRFGQNFLTDKNILNKIVRAAEVSPSNTVLEIGPGLGHLTRALAETNAHIVAVEVDRDLIANLRTEFSEMRNVHLLEGDILKQAPEAWLAQGNASTPYIVVANIPYYITSAILRYLLEAQTPPERIVVMVQRQVAQQITAKPPHANLLGVSVQYYGVPQIVGNVAAGAFYPRPQVDSAVVRIDVTSAPSEKDSARFFRIVRAGFGAKRKQLHNALTLGLNLSGEEVGKMLAQAHINPTRRAETLTLAEWETLAHTSKSFLN